MSDRWFDHDEELWINERSGSQLFYELGANYGPPDNRRQHSVVITVRAAHCAPILGDRDMAKRLVLAVFRHESARVRDLDDDPGRTPAELGYESVEPDHDSLTAKWRRTLLAPGLRNLQEWTEFVERKVAGVTDGTR